MRPDRIDVGLVLKAWAYSRFMCWKNMLLVLENHFVLHKIAEIFWNQKVQSTVIFVVIVNRDFIRGAEHRNN